MLDRPRAVGTVARRARAAFRRHGRKLLRWREKLRLSEEAVHLVLAGCVGVVGGMVNLALYWLNVGVQGVALSGFDDVLLLVEGLEGWQRLLLPAGGGLLAGLTLFLGLRLVRMPGATNLLEVVVVGDGRLRLRPAVVQSISSVLSIGTGGSIGREGPITQLSATLVSKFGQLMHWQPYRLRLLVACGAAAGMAAAYNAPVAGAVFAAQIVLGNFSMTLFAPLVFASVVATMVSRSFFEIGPWYEVPAYLEFTSMRQLPWFLVLGLLSGGMGALFLAGLRHSAKWFNRIPQPLYIRMALGGLVVGAIAMLAPEVWGNGYSATNRILQDQYQMLQGEQALRWVALILVAKLVATIVTVGSGAVGGVFTPTLFLGAGLGAVMGMTLHSWGYATELSTAAFALVGMGSVLSATTHSPLLAMIMVFEISLNHTLIPPLMLACAVSTLVSRRFQRDNVYTEPLRRRGFELDRESARLGAATQQTVGDVLREPVPPVNQRAGFQELADRFLTSSHNFLPVVDDNHRLVGVIALHDLKQHLSAGAELSGVIAYDVMRPPPPFLTPDQKLADVFPILLASELRHVPVVNTAKERRLVGSVQRSEILGVLSEAIASRGASD
jgi:chloride channel protein, CIC family